MIDRKLYLWKCSWPDCGHEFKMRMGYTDREGGGSSMVRCPRCKNNLKADSYVKEVKKKRFGGE